MKKGKTDQEPQGLTYLEAGWTYLAKEEGSSLCPSRALAGEKIRGEKSNFLQMRQSARIRGLERVLDLLTGSALGPRKARPNHLKAERKIGFTIIFY